MSRNIVDGYASLLSGYFSLDQSEANEHTDNDDQKDKFDLPAFLPTNTNSIHVSESLTRMMSTLSNCINDLNGIHLPGEAFSGLTELMDKARSKFINVICLCWERGK